MVNKTILVTGGCGFIGSNLCKELTKNKENFVICIDNMYSGTYQNIFDLVTLDNFVFKKHDVTKPMVSLLETILKNNNGSLRLDEIYHLACPASPVFYQNDPTKTIKTCLHGMFNIIKLCKKYKCKMLFTSTSEVYGDPLEHPQKETYWGNVNCVGIRSNYDESKRMCETIIYEYRNKYDLDLKIVRIFNTYGPKMRLDDGRVITNFLRCIKENKPITIYGDGNQTRSFCYVDDMVDGLIKMMASTEEGPINLGNPYCEFNMNQLLEVFEKVLNRPLLTTYKPLPLDDPKQRKPDISLANSKLGWNPSVTLYDGIKKMISSTQLI
ncbi:NAD-dependent dehydratase [Tupanvirus deep ocean]|uniref:NAD-dependent dehydratase n=2 Tax=Tupanvirus TaxID=2094720 RepID=A0AC62A797_9VIRU|nr:NAD-dependent dehydratase [Tupanvirus deep ocean]QKU33570.1 NAD-dependent dehydratase [Tupanvirus deep ocean]